MSSDEKLQTAEGDSWCNPPQLFVALGIAVATFLVLLAYRYEAPYPGATSIDVLEALGVRPRAFARSPVWFWLLNSLASAKSSAFSNVQMASFIVGAISNGLIYLIISSYTLATVEYDLRHGVRKFMCTILPVVGSMLFISFPPIWTSVQNACSDVSANFFCLLTVALVLASLDRAKRWLLVATALVAGIGSVESPTVFGVAVFMIFFHRFSPLLVSFPEIDTTKVDIYAKRARIAPLCVAVFIVAALATAWLGIRSFTGSEGFALRGFHDFNHVARVFVVDYMMQVLKAVPTLGWLIVGFGLVIPCLLIWTLARRIAEGDTAWGIVLFYAIAGSVVVMQALWPGESGLWVFFSGPAFRSACCAMMAIAGGIAITELAQLLLNSVHSLKESTELTAFDHGMVTVISIIAIALIGAMTAFASAQVSSEKNRESIRIIHDASNEMLREAEGTDWIFTDGTYDSGMLYCSWTEGYQTKIITLVQGDNWWEKAQVLNRLPDGISQNLYMMSVSAMAKDWVRNRADMKDRISAQIGLDIWTGTDAHVMPCKTIFIPERAMEPDEIKASLRERMEYWQGLLERIESVDKPGTERYLRAIIQGLRRQVSLVANETGVFAEDNGLAQESIEAYQMAMKFNEYNISAGLNLLALATAGYDVPNREEIFATVSNIIKLTNKFSVVFLSRYCGTIRNAEFQEKLGLALMNGGDNFSGASRLFEKSLELESERASGAASVERIIRNRTMIAVERANHGGKDKAMAEAEQIVADYPDNAESYLSAAAILSAIGEQERAQMSVEAARGKGADQERCDVMLALSMREQGDFKGIMDLLVPYLDIEERANSQVFQLLGEAVTKCNSNDEYLTRIRGRMNRDFESRIPLLKMQTQFQIGSGDLPGALSSLNEILRATPSDWWAMDLSLRINLGMNRLYEASEVASKMLEVQQRHLPAIYVLGAYELDQRHGKAAEGFLLRCIELDQTNPVFWNSLAYAQMYQEKLAEAKESVLRAIALAPSKYEVWDTLAEIALASGDHATADNASQQSLQLAPNKPQAYLRRIEVELALEHVANADEMILAFQKSKAMKNLDHAARIKALRKKCDELKSELNLDSSK